VNPLRWFGRWLDRYLDRVIAEAINDLNQAELTDAGSPIFDELLAFYTPIGLDAAVDLTDERIAEFIEDGI